MPNELVPTVEAFLFSGWLAIHNWTDLLIVALIWWGTSRMYAGVEVRRNAAAQTRSRYHSAQLQAWLNDGQPHSWVPQSNPRPDSSSPFDW